MMREHTASEIAYKENATRSIDNTPYVTVEDARKEANSAYAEGYLDGHTENIYQTTNDCARILNEHRDALIDTLGDKVDPTVAAWVEGVIVDLNAYANTRVDRIKAGK